MQAGQELCTQRQPRTCEAAVLRRAGAAGEFRTRRTDSYSRRLTMTVLVTARLPRSRSRPKARPRGRARASARAIAARESDPGRASDAQRSPRRWIARIDGEHEHRIRAAACLGRRCAVQHRRGVARVVRRRRDRLAHHRAHRRRPAWAPQGDAQRVHGSRRSARRRIRRSARHRRRLARDHVVAAHDHAAPRGASPDRSRHRVGWLRIRGAPARSDARLRPLAARFDRLAAGVAAASAGAVVAAAAWAVAPR